VVASSRNYSVFYDIINKPPIHETYTVTLYINQFWLSVSLWRQLVSRT